MFKWREISFNKLIKKKTKGSTLLEIVIAFAIISIMMVPLGGALVTSVKTNKISEVKQEAKLVSQEIIEKIRNNGEITETKDSLIVGENQKYKVDIIKDNNDTRKNNYLITGKTSNGVEVLSGSIKQANGEITNIVGSNSEQKVKLLVYLDKDWNENKTIKYTICNSIGVNSENGTIEWHLKQQKNPLKKKGKLNIHIDKNRKLSIKDDNEKDEVLLNLNNQDIDIGVYVEKGMTINSKLAVVCQSKVDIKFYVFNSLFENIIGEFTNGNVNNNEKKPTITICNTDVVDKTTKAISMYTVKLNFKSKINGNTIVESTKSEVFLGD